ncbi:class I SAM-dependent methyltransferase [Novosphingobium flavum]|uniref:Class I SAM-dependent methyltransferase n=1 Tax=Novosphingobium flavum TaxID=1778672 RepID=A0A7X1FTH8_9SPHN|nr:class I SAM-dependent methyltransferase [Novosphingobium flavum]MBC2666067.1 class I SAM-dependent methyltransferase [Novosphingobium flavum]
MPQEPSHEQRVITQFAPRAAAYVSSPVHAAGPDLDRIEQVAAELRPARALDLGCGGGHVSYRIAPHAGEVVACDLSADMVAAVRAAAAERGLANITGAVAPAEALPFADGAFDFLACRMTAHHWRDWEAGLREARRVLRQGSRAAFVDVAAPEDSVADVHLQAVELLRDTSHVRDYRASEWLAGLGRAGFTVNAVRTHRLRMDFASWIARMGPPESHVAAIRSLLAGASTPVARALEIEPDGSFSFDVVTIEAS